MIRSNWPMLAACSILVFAAVAHGWRTDRWGASGDLAAAAAALEGVPMKIGAWEAATVELSAEQVKAARLAGVTARKYTHRYTGSEITVIIACGRPGPIAVHTPDVCYQGAGYVMGNQKAEPLGDGNTAWASDFTKGGAQPLTLRIRWAWSIGGSWSASESPRVEFARAHVLYKMYLIRTVSPGNSEKDQQQEHEFDAEFLSGLQAVLN